MRTELGRLVAGLVVEGVAAAQDVECVAVGEPEVFQDVEVQGGQGVATDPVVGKDHDHVVEVPKPLEPLAQLVGGPLVGRLGEALGGSSDTRTVALGVCRRIRVGLDSCGQADRRCRRDGLR